MKDENKQFDRRKSCLMNREAFNFMLDLAKTYDEEETQIFKFLKLYCEYAYDEIEPPDLNAAGIDKGVIIAWADFKKKIDLSQRHREIRFNNNKESKEERADRERKELEIVRAHPELKVTEFGQFGIGKNRVSMLRNKYGLIGPKAQAKLEAENEAEIQAQNSTAVGAENSPENSVESGAENTSRSSQKTAQKTGENLSQKTHQNQGQNQGQKSTENSHKKSSSNAVTNAVTETSLTADPQEQTQQSEDKFIEITHAAESINNSQPETNITDPTAEKSYSHSHGAYEYVIIGNREYNSESENPKSYSQFPMGIDSKNENVFPVSHGNRKSYSQFPMGIEIQNDEKSKSYSQFPMGIDPKNAQNDPKNAVSPCTPFSRECDGGNGYVIIGNREYNSPPGNSINLIPSNAVAAAPASNVADAPPTAAGAAPTTNTLSNSIKLRVREMWQPGVKKKEVIDQIKAEFGVTIKTSNVDQIWDKYKDKNEYEKLRHLVEQEQAKNTQQIKMSKNTTQKLGVLMSCMS